jgi:tetratricopeptide (TPR) repeat protein
VSIGVAGMLALLSAHAGAARPTAPAPASAPAAHPPVGRVQLIGWLIGGVDPAYVVVLVRERGLGFVPATDYVDLVTPGHRGDSLESALKAAAPPAGAVAPEDDSLVSAMERGMARYNAHDQPGTEREVAAAMRLAPGNAAVRLALGRALAGRGAADSATAQYRTALELEPGIPGAHLQIGALRQYQQDLEGAIAEMHQEIVSHPANAVAHGQLGYLLGQSGDVSSAIQEVRESVRLDPNNGAARMQLANGLYATRDFRGAEAQARAALELAPSPQAVAVSQVMRGLALRALFDMSGSLAAFRAAIAADNLNPDAHFGLARVYTLQGDENEALREFDLAMSHHLNRPDVIQAHVQRAAILDHQGEVTRALEEYRIAIEMDPENQELARERDELAARAPKPGPASK